MHKILYLLIIISYSSFVSGQVTVLDKEIRMLALGDSYTIGESVDIQDRWPHQLMSELRQRGMEGPDPDYIATTGWTSGDLIQGIQGRLDTSKSYNLVSILIGVNNQYQGLPIAAYEPELRQIIQLALEVVDQDTSRILILSIPDYAYTPFGNSNARISEEIDIYNGIKKRVADQWGILCVDITPISRMGFERPSLVAPDGLHPSGEQYAAWVKAILSNAGFSGSVTQDDPPLSSGQKLTVFPNPVTSNLYLEGSMEVSGALVYDIQGKFISGFALNRLPASLDLSTLDPGLYLLRFIPSRQEQHTISQWILKSG